MCVLLLAHVASAMLGPSHQQVCRRRAVLLGAGSALFAWQPSPSFAADQGITAGERKGIIERARSSTLTTARAIDRAKANTLFDGRLPDVNCKDVIKLMDGAPATPGPGPAPTSSSVFPNAPRPRKCHPQLTRRRSKRRAF